MELHPSLIRLESAKLALSEAKTLVDVKDIRDRAEALRVYSKQAKDSLEIQNACAEIKLRAERRAGEMLAETITLGRPEKGNTVLPLSEVGISKIESSRWQRIALIPETAFESQITSTLSERKELTTAAMLKLANQFAPKNGAKKAEEMPSAQVCTDLNELVSAGRKFGCIYVDPPWQYSNQGTRASTDNHYSTMTVDQICALPVRELAADKCHLHLWTTNGFLFECPKIFEAWGFEFKSSFVWVKPQMGIGNYWRNSHEFMLLAVKGGQTAISKSEMSWISAKRGTHSAKPRCVRDTIQRLSPGPYLELFGRYPVDGWTVFGDQVATDILIP